MDIKLVLLLLVLIPIIVAGGIVSLNIPMNTLFVVVLGGVMIYLVYTLYARRVDRDVIQSDKKKATPAKMYMDGVDFMPTSRNVLYGYHFKSVAAAGPIVGGTIPNSPFTLILIALGLGCGALYLLRRNAPQVG